MKEVAIQTTPQNCKTLMHAHLPSYADAGVSNFEILTNSKMRHKRQAIVQFNSLFHFTQSNTIFTVHQVIYIINKLYRRSYCFQLHYSWFLFSIICMFCGNREGISDNSPDPNENCKTNLSLRAGCTCDYPDRAFAKSDALCRMTWLYNIKSIKLL